VRDTHPTTCGHIKANQLATFVDNSNEADVVGKDIDIVNWWDCNSNFELKIGDQVFVKEYHHETNLSRQIELAVERFKVFKCLTGHLLLVQPDFMVGRCPGQKMFADTLCKLVHLGMQFR
jgi:hypothetical protein